MRIAHVTDCYLPRLGGIEVTVAELARRQRLSGHDVTVVTSTAGDRSREPGVVGLAGRARRPGRISYTRSAGVEAVLRDGGFDVVHAHVSAFSPLAYRSARYAAATSTPAVVSVHSLLAGAAPLLRAAAATAGWSGWPLRWTAVSRVAAADLISVVGRRTEVTVVPNGVDPEEWRPATPTGVSPVLRVAAVGRLARRKRVLDLARLLLRARRDLPAGSGLHVEIAGEGPERRTLERFLRRHRMQGWVHLRGALTPPEIRELFARSDLFVAPAVLESFGIAALEARCSGLPVLARAGTGIADFVGHGSEGWLVGSDDEMAAMIATMAGDRSELDRVAAHNRTVAPRAGWDLTTGRYGEVYELAVAGGALQAASHDGA